MSSLKQSGDVLLRQGALLSPDPTFGEGFLIFNIIVSNGLMTMTETFETAAVLSLFGGNFDDDGTTGTKSKTYWGNLIENDPAAKYVSRTQNLLQGLPATSANLIRLDEAAALDLAWFVDTGIANNVEVFSFIPSVKRVNLTTRIEAIGREEEFTFTANWKASV